VSTPAGIIIEAEAAVYVVAQGQELLGQRQTDASRAACTDLFIIYLFNLFIYLFIVYWHVLSCRGGGGLVPVMITLRPGGRL
jgi:hypothetical protein